MDEETLLAGHKKRQCRVDNGAQNRMSAQTRGHLQLCKFTQQSQLKFRSAVQIFESRTFEKKPKIHAKAKVRSFSSATAKIQQEPKISRQNSDSGTKVSLKKLGGDLKRYCVHRYKSLINPGT